MRPGIPEMHFTFNWIAKNPRCFYRGLGQGAWETFAYFG